MIFLTRIFSFYRLPENFWKRDFSIFQHSWANKTPAIQIYRQDDPNTLKNIAVGYIPLPKEWCVFHRAKLYGPPEIAPFPTSALAYAGCPTILLFLKTIAQPPHNWEPLIPHGLFWTFNLLAFYLTHIKIIHKGWVKMTMNQLMTIIIIYQKYAFLYANFRQIEFVNCVYSKSVTLQ